MTILKSNIIPGLVPPFDDELLSSWIYRLSIEHRIKPQTFTSFYFKEYNFWCRDVDKFIPEDVIKIISNMTNLNYSEIRELQLEFYSNKLFENILPSYTDGLTNIGIYHRTRIRFGLLACPSCLDQNQYFRKNWRLITSLVCTKCNCHLIDKCQNCSAPIIFQRLEIGNKNDFLNKPIYLCWKCNYDYRKKITYINHNALLIEYQSYIDNLITNGFNEKYNYSFLYTKILLLFLRKLVTKSKNWNRIRNGFINEYNLNSYEFFNSKMIYNSSLEFRCQNLPLINLLLSDIENKFIPFCKKNKIRYSDFSKDDNVLPFWFYNSFMNSF